MGRKAIALFCALSLALSWAIQAALLLTFGMDSPEASVFLLACMWSPTVLSLIFLLFHKRAREGVLAPWRLGKLSYWPLGVLFATVVAFALVGVFLHLGWATSPWFAFAPDAVAVSGGPWVLGRGAQAWPLFAANVLATAAVFAVINLVAAAGEEFAWRGFLQGHMVRRFGTSGGVVILGLFWSFWHLPMLLNGYNHPEAPILGAFVLFPIQLVAMSFFMGWLTIRSGSFWPAALAHGAGNSIQAGVVEHLELSVPRLYADLLSLALIVVLGLACWAALARRRSLPSPARLAPA